MSRRESVVVRASGKVRNAVGLVLALTFAMTLTFVVSLPLILLGLWLRRSLDEWKARRLLLSLYRSRVAGVELVPAMREPPSMEGFR